MLLIAHRGNITGPNPELENSILYVEYALSQGYAAEIDLRVIDHKIYLGHDEPQYEIGLAWLMANKHHLWVHCKNAAAIEICQRTNLHYFWHQEDDYTVTSLGYIWAYPGKEPPSEKTITVLPELHWNMDEYKNHTTMGVCSDFVGTMKALGA